MGRLSLLMCGPRKLGKGTSNSNVLAVGWFVARPFGRHLGFHWINPFVNRRENIRKWETAKIEVEWEDSSVTPTNVCKDT